MNERDKTRFQDMLDAAQKALSFVSGKTRNELASDDLLAFGLTRAVEIIGEAAARITPETQALYPEVAWKGIVGIRNKIVHDYISIDYDIIWDVVTFDLPTLVSQIEAILLSNSTIDSE